MDADTSASRPGSAGGRHLSGKSLAFAGMIGHRGGATSPERTVSAKKRSEIIPSPTSQEGPTRAQLDDVAAFCTARLAASEEQLPEPFGNNLMVLSAWWAVPLYVRLSNVLASATFDDEAWGRASEVVCGAVAGDILAGLTGDGSERDALAAALANHVKGVCKLWSAAFGSPAVAERFDDVAHVAAELQALFTNETLGLQDSFGLAGGGAGGGAGSGAGADPEDLAAFCNAFAEYFHICTRALPGE